MKSEEEMRSTLTRVYKGSMLPSVDVGPDQYDELFDIALACVSEVTRTPEDDILGRRRFQPCCTYRFMLYKLVRHEIGTGEDGAFGMEPTLQWIADKMGFRNPDNKRDHGTILHGIEQIEMYLESDRSVEPIYMKVLARFEIARAEYLSLHVDAETDEKIVGLKKAAATIARSIKNHEDHLAKVMEQLAKAELKGGSNENMVQDKRTSDG